jgi:hypothetical protein
MSQEPDVVRQLRNELQQQKQQMDADLLRLAKAVLARYPIEGAWETFCPYCCARAEAGPVDHQADCAVLIARRYVKT